MHSICPVPKRLTVFSLQAFDDAISELRQEDLGAHMVAIFVSDERFCCASKSYELCAVQANILVLRYLSVAWLLP